MLLVQHYEFGGNLLDEVEIEDIKDLANTGWEIKPGDEILILDADNPEEFGY